MEEKEKTVRNFVINYEDGSSKTIEKGFFCELKMLPDSECKMCFDMAGMKGSDLEYIVWGCIQLGARLGMFRDKKDSEKVAESDAT